MKKIAFRFLSVSLAFLLAINTAAAGRWLRGCWDAPAACPTPCVSAPVCEPVVCCEPVACGSMPIVTETTGCGCGETVVSHSAPIVPSAPTIASEPTPVMPPAPTEVYEPAPANAFDGGFRSDNAAPAAAAEADNDPPSDDWDAGIDQPAEEMVTEELPPADDADDFGGFEEPAAEDPADDLFAEEPAMEEPMADEPADDLFGEEPADEPMDNDDDLFGSDEPAADEFGSDDAAGDDLFGEDAAEEPADDLFGAEPMEEPADEPMEGDDDLFGSDDASGDDLFGEEAAEEPADEMAADEDLFGADAEEPAFEEAADDLFGEPAAEEPADDLFDDEGFDPPAADEAPADAMPADEAAGEEAPASDTEEAFDDLFGGFGAILREPGGVESAQDRTWIDNSGRFSTVGRLVAIDAGAVRLMKQSGAMATVPLARLSQSDLEFVSRQSLAQHHVQEAMIARGVRPAADQPKQASTAAPLRTAQL